MRLAAVFAVTVLTALLGTRAGNVRAAFPGLAPPFEQQDFLTGFPNDGHFGPTGIAFSGNGDILVADAADGNLYRFTAAGGRAGTPLSHIGPTLGLVFAGDGKLYAARRASSSIVELDAKSGAVVRTVASGFSNLIAGLAVDPKSSDIFATDQAANGYASSPGVFRINPSNGTVTTYANGALFTAPDGLVLDPDGILYVSNERGSGDVIRVDQQGNASVLVTLPGGPDGLAVGKPGGSLAGSLIVDRNDGVISRIDLTTTPITVTEFASGGSRGDFVAVSPDGYLFATQTDLVVKFSPASFQVSVGGTRSSLPLQIYVGFIAIALLAAIGLGSGALWRRARIRRKQLAVVAANPTEVEIPRSLPQARAITGTGSATASGRLIEQCGDGTTKTHEIGDGSISIGAAPECTIRVAKTADIANYHARVSFRRGRYMLHHTGGPSAVTTVSGQRVDWVRLEAGDEIQVGSHRLLFEAPATSP